MKDLRMYIQIQDLKRNGFSRRKTAELLKVCRETVSSYWEMTDDEYTALEEQYAKKGSLVKYDSVIIEWLYRYPSMTSAQIYDWLQEHYRIELSERAVRRHVSGIRLDYGIKKTLTPRDYESVEELPMGHQMQIDFGQTSLRTPGGQYIKVYFVGVVLAHSRYKWGFFLDRPFCSIDLVNSLDRCFSELGGTCNELVFDQDSIVSVSENHGDIIFTHEFEKYRKLHNLNVFMCRKSDPETKGKIESVVKYVKNNFLANRVFMGIDLLNESFTDWLERTGNRKVHGTTKKVPAKVFELERSHLRPILTATDIYHTESISRMVRKDNTIIYEANRYSVPLGTFNQDKEVCIEVVGDKLVISKIFGEYVIAEHTLSAGKGVLVKNTNHSRNREPAIDELYAAISATLLSKCDDFLKTIRIKKNRYVRDQYALLDKLVKANGAELVIDAVEYCKEHELISATDVRDAIVFISSESKQKPSFEIPPLKLIGNPLAGSVNTQKRNISAYSRLGEAHHDS